MHHPIWPCSAQLSCKPSMSPLLCQNASMAAMEHIHNPQHRFSCMAEWLCSPVLSDVTVQCTDGALPAHKLVLASGSTLLANAITNSQDAVALGQVVPFPFSLTTTKFTERDGHCVQHQVPLSRQTDRQTCRQTTY